jgi:hypothetical protein
VRLQLLTSSTGFFERPAALPRKNPVGKAPTGVGGLAWAARPAQQATLVVLAHGGDAEALVQLLGLYWP